MEENQKPNDEQLNKENTKQPLNERLKEFADGISGEFKKIVWPNRKDLIKQTATVIITSMIVGVIIFGMDTVFGFTYSNIVRLLG